MDWNGRATENILWKGFGVPSSMSGLPLRYIYIKPANGGFNLYEELEEYMR